MDIESNHPIYTMCRGGNGRKIGEEGDFRTSKMAENRQNEEIGTICLRFCPLRPSWHPSSQIRSVFYAMFHGGLAEARNEIEIRDVEANAFLTLLRYLYCDQIKLADDDVLATL